MLASSRAALRARGMPHALGFAARDIGGGGIPDQWGQPKTGGTQFLGTPANYMQLLKTRPVSPDLFGVEGTAAWSEQRAVLFALQRAAVLTRCTPRRQAGPTTSSPPSPCLPSPTG